MQLTGNACLMSTYSYFAHKENHVQDCVDNIREFIHSPHSNTRKSQCKIFLSSFLRLVRPISPFSYCITLLGSWPTTKVTSRTTSIRKWIVILPNDLAIIYNRSSNANPNTIWSGHFKLKLFQWHMQTFFEVSFAPFNVELLMEKDCLCNILGNLTLRRVGGKKRNKFGNCANSFDEVADQFRLSFSVRTIISWIS